MHNYPKTSYYDWLHASDSERRKIRNQWNVDNDEGKEIALKIAKLFKNECVYNVHDVEVIRELNCWIINAFVSVNDYSSLKTRSNIEFLGITVKFSKINE